MHLHDSYPTEFYVSDVGYLVLKQDCFECGRVTQFFNLLPDLMKLQTQRWTGIFVPDSEEEDDV